MDPAPDVSHSDPPLLRFGAEMKARKLRGMPFRQAWFESMSAAMPKGSGEFSLRCALMDTQRAWREAYEDQPSALAELRDIAA